MFYSTYKPDGKMRDFYIIKFSRLKSFKRRRKNTFIKILTSLRYVSPLFNTIAGLIQDVLEKSDKYY
jgi:hypothetical protein